MTYICHAKGCKYTTENLNRTFSHEKRKGGDHKMGIDFKKFLSDPKVTANIERLNREEDERKAEALKQYNKDKEARLVLLHHAMKGWNYNGQGTRRLLEQFIEEVAGSY
jgi:hypothetical protein